MLLSLTSCASNPLEIVVETETVLLEVAVIVNVPLVMTEPVPMPILPPNPSPKQLGDTYVDTVLSLEAANKQLGKIAGLAPPE